MNAFKLKILAVSFMVADHLAKLFLMVGIPTMFMPFISLMLMAGRLSFPLFAFLIANGLRHTRSVEKYLARLLIFAVISQIPFALLFTVSAGQPLTLENATMTLNIFFTLFAGAAACVLFDRIQNKFLRYSVVTLISIIAWIFRFDYIFYGVWLIFLFHRYYDDVKPGFPYFLILTAGICGYFYAIELDLRMALLQILSLFALFFTRRYDHTAGPVKWKYWFYAFYPAHLLVLWMLYIVMRR